jgi:hypothetical protein
MNTLQRHGREIFREAKSGLVGKAENWEPIEIWILLSGTETVMVRLATLCVVFSLIAMPARAASRVSLADHVADLIRAGQTVVTTRSYLRRCVRMQRAELRRAGQKAVDQARSDALAKRP